MEFAHFILEHDGEDPVRLALARDRFAGQVEDFDLALSTLEARQKLRAKVPEWVALPQLRYPFRLSAEQCSSSETARYKASVALLACGVTSAPSKKAENAGTGVLADVDAVKKGPKCRRPCRLADLTGGLGVDSWAFSQVFGEVLFNEMRPELADSAVHNFRELGVTNIAMRNSALVPAGMAGTDRPENGKTVEEILNGFQPDIIFLDPARRASDGRKVFRLEDCQPDVLQLLPELLAACPKLLLKLSPMADISLVCKQLRHVKAVHVVAAEGECKELLLLLERGYVGPYALIVNEGGAVLAVYEGCGLPAVDQVHVPAPSAQYLFEPGKALLKAGAFELPCRYGLEKLDRHTHLYVGAAVPEALKPFGKVFEILEIAPLNKRSIKDIGERYPSAEVTARNLPLTSDELRAKLRCRSGGSVHIFACMAGKEKRLLVVKPI